MFNFLSSIYILSFFSGIYSGFSKFTLSMWLKYSGWGIVALSYFNLTLLPHGLRSFWMPFLENLSFKLNNYGSKKNLIIIFDFLISVMSFLLFFLQKQNLIIFIIFLMLYAVLISSREAVAIGYQMEFIPKENLGKIEGKVNMFYYIGMWLGGSVVLLLSEFYSWYFLFNCISSIFLINCFITFHLANSKNETQKIANKKYSSNWKEKFFEPYKDLINNNKNILFYLIGFVAFYRLQDRILMGVTNFYFIDLGFTKYDMIIVKALGTFATILGGLFSSYVVGKINYKKTLIFGVFFHAFAILLLWVQSFFQIQSYLFFLIINILEKMSRGFEANIFFTYQLLFCSKKYSMSQISILSSFDKLNGTLISLFSGYFIAQYGWTSFFLLSFFALIPAIYFLSKLRD